MMAAEKKTNNRLLKRIIVCQVTNPNNRFGAKVDCCPTETITIGQVQQVPVFFKWPIHNGRSEAYLICYIPSHTLHRLVGKNSESALIMTFWKMVHFWFYGQKIVFSVLRALQDVLFQNYIHSTVLRILLNVTKFFKHGVGSKKPIFPCVSSGQ